MYGVPWRDDAVLSLTLIPIKDLQSHLFLLPLTRRTLLTLLSYTLRSFFSFIDLFPFGVTFSTSLSLPRLFLDLHLHLHLQLLIITTPTNLNGRRT